MPCFLLILMFSEATPTSAIKAYSGASCDTFTSLKDATLSLSLETNVCQPQSGGDLFVKWEDTKTANELLSLVKTDQILDVNGFAVSADSGLIAVATVSSVQSCFRGDDDQYRSTFCKRGEF